MFPSDLLVSMREVVSKVHGLEPILKEVIQIQLVVDANIVQGEIRWRAGKRKNPRARTGFQEAIDSGIVIAVAPTFLKAEIEEHLMDIAADLGVTIEEVQRHWNEIQGSLLFYRPRLLRNEGDWVSDQDDLAYKHACDELGAIAVYSRDSHFKSMKVPLVSISLDLTLRKYARANSVVLGVTIGSGVTLMIGFGALGGMFKLVKKALDAFGQLPGWVQIGIAIAMFTVFAHPKSRAKLSEAWQSICVALRAAEPAFANVLLQIGDQFVVAKTNAGETFAEIQAILPKPRRRSALKQARSICLVNKKGPLSIEELDRHLRNQGYSSRSKDFRLYLRRVLRESGQFVETSPNKWGLRE